LGHQHYGLAARGRQLRAGAAEHGLGPRSVAGGFGDADRWRLATNAAAPQGRARLVNLKPQAEPLPFEAEDAEPTTRPVLQSRERMKAGVLLPTAKAAPRPLPAQEETHKSESRLSVRSSRRQEIMRDP